MKRPPNVERLLRIEYLAMNLVQKLAEIEAPMMHYMAEAAGFGTPDYVGPDYREELFELRETIKGKP